MLEGCKRQLGQLIGGIICHPYELTLYRNEISAYLAEVSKPWPPPYCCCQDEESLVVVRDDRLHLFDLSGKHCHAYYSNVISTTPI